MKRCLVIGGAGFIGTNLAVCMRRNGYVVTLYDRVEQTELSERLMGMEYIQADYFKKLPEDDIVKQQDMVILLISSVGPGESMEDPKVCYTIDVVRLIDLLEQMLRCGVKRVVFVSSGGTVYGNQGKDILKEDMETYPINHYGIMKLMQEKILLMYNEMYGMHNVIFRLANPYGEGQRMASGIGAVTAFLYNIMHEEEICVYGGGEAVRDYIYIEDAVNMMRLLLDTGEDANKKAIYNIGTGKGNKIIDVLYMAEKVTGREARVTYSNKREFDVSENVLDIARIRSMIGDYKCRDLETGMREYYEILKE